MLTYDNNKLKMIKKFLIEKEKLKDFFESLMQNFEVVAPVEKEGIHSFRKIKNFEEVNLNFINTLYPPKKYFLPHKEKILEYGEKIEIPSEKVKRVIFGIRPCDVHSLKNQDKVFLNDGFVDEYYQKKRRNTLLLALNCSLAGENCFCESLGTNQLSPNDFDLLLTEDEGAYLVEVGSEKGKKLIDKNKKLFRRTNKAVKEKIKCKRELRKKEIKKLEALKNFHSKIWEEEAKKCLSCCSCTITCPTCTCFGLRDLIKIDLKSGSRIREWQSCQLKVFTKVAGGFVFREERAKRLKHRIYHQLNYFKKRYGVNLCVGCGRCIENCPTKIDMIKILKKL